jgi:hypothetical protein
MQIPIHSTAVGFDIALIWHLPPVPEHSVTRLVLLIPVPNWHQHFVSFLYWTDHMLDSLVCQYFLQLKSMTHFELTATQVTVLYFDFKNTFRIMSYSSLYNAMQIFDTIQ